ncbi:MAG: apolipoprotein N-acyltransferase [Thermodesulfovibrionia bacterium]|nr:apolipoprotein N-acyltransferase [Thermodesulfovibrionia bacterium]
MDNRASIFFSIIAGVLLVAGFPPFDLYPLTWIALIPLFMALRDKGAKASFYIGSLTGLVFFTGALYWVFHSIYYYSSIPAVLSVFIVLLLCLFLSLYIGLFSMLFALISDRSRMPALFIAPVLWVTLEVVRSYAFTGFPWLLLGYSQYKFLPIIQIADITGIYGVSFLVVAFNGAVFDIAVSWPKKIRRMPLLGKSHITAGVVIYGLLLAASLIYGFWELNKSQDKAKTITASVIQGNIGQDRKWDAASSKEIVDIYKRLSLEVAAESPDLIVWPEAALPFVFSKGSSSAIDLLDFQKGIGIHLLTGGITENKSETGGSEFANSAILISPKGEVVSVYDKIHLVPFGEYVPLARFFPFIKKLVIDIGDFRSGEVYTVMEMPPAKIASLICYEIIFPGLTRKFVNKGANVLVTITNDAWFGKTPAPYQHFSMAVFRAVENRVPVVRAANTGISGFIDTRGRVMGSSGIFVQAKMTKELSLGPDEKTFYTKFGDLFAFLCIISSVILIANCLFPERKGKYKEGY